MSNSEIFSVVASFQCQRVTFRSYRILTVREHFDDLGKNNLTILVQETCHRVPRHPGVMLDSKLGLFAIARFSIDTLVQVIKMALLQERFIRALN